MWCEHCQADVSPTPGSPDGESRCTRCGSRISVGIRKGDNIQQARAILERWQSGDLLDQIRSSEELPPLVWSTDLNRQSKPGIPSGGSFKSTDSSGALNRGRDPGRSGEKRQEEPQKWMPPRVRSANETAPFQRTPAKDDLPKHDPKTETIPTAARPPVVSVTPGEKPDDETLPVPSMKQFAELLSASILPAKDVLPTKTAEPRATVYPNPDLDERLNQPLEFEIRPPVFLRMPRNTGSTETDTTAKDSSPQVGTPAETSTPPAAQSSDISITAAVDSDQIAREKAISPRDVILEKRRDDSLEIPPALADQPDQSLSSAESIMLTERDNSARGSEERPETQLPADSAPSSQTKTNKTRALQRTSVHRRVQPSSSSSGLTSGKKPVSRKFRIDQPGDKSDEQSELTARATSSDAAGPRSSAAPERKLVSNSLPGQGRRLRIDDPEPVEKLAETANSRTRTQGKAYRRYIDEPHASQPRGPHFQVTAPTRSNLTAMTGQFLAYLGVLGLTIGTAIVIYGHFGGYSEYTPTGWLVTTVAQMLLFLGVINLVSGGIEQNNEDVSRRINTLGEHLVRIEQVTEEVLRGPRISPRIYADPENAELQTTTRETSTID